MKRLAKNLKLIRKGRWKMSQEKFAVLMDSSRSKVNSYENNNIEPSLEYMIKLQSMSGLNVEEIFYNPLTLDQIPAQPLSPDNREITVTTDDQISYRKEEINELIDYDYKVKRRFRNLEERLQALEMQVLPEDEEAAEED